MVYLKWEYDDGYDVKTNKVYRTVGRIFPFLPPKYVPDEEAYRYRVKFNISIYFCDSPDLQRWIVRRKIYGVVVVEVMDHEYEGGLDEWVPHWTEFMARRYRDSSHQELGYSLVYCRCSELGGEPFKIEVLEKEYIPPVKKVNKYRERQIEMLERQRDTARTEKIRKSIQDTIDVLKKKYGIK